MDEKIIARFWSKVDKNGPVPEHVPELGPCWRWKGGTDADGYGVFKMRLPGLSPHGKVFKAHRVSLELKLGRELTSGEHSCHYCDNPPCTNPNHLWIGDTVSNTADRDAKGRGSSGDQHWTHTRPEGLARGLRSGSYTHPELRRRGETHGMSKLTEEDVKTIRSLRDSGYSLHRLGEMFGVAHPTIRSVVLRKTWAHVT